MQNFLNKFKGKEEDEELKYRYIRISAKLKAYTGDLYDYDDQKNDNELQHYISAIKSFRIGKFDNALNHVNKILMIKPNDPLIRLGKAIVGINNYENKEQQKENEKEKFGLARIQNANKSFLKRNFDSLIS